MNLLSASGLSEQANGLSGTTARSFAQQVVWVVDVADPLQVVARLAHGELLALALHQSHALTKSVERARNRLQ